MYRARQPICSDKANSEIPGENENLESVSESDGLEKSNNFFSCDDTCAICKICGKKDHKSYVSPFSGRRKASYLACDKFLRMSPLERGKVLDDKGLCRQCLCPGAKKGHPYFCNKTYICANPSHDSSEGYHVLVCDKHKDTPENARLLEKFKEECIQKFSKDLPSSSVDIKITMQHQATCVDTALEEGEDLNKGIFMLQTIKIEGEKFNLFYDSGCTDMICKKSAINRLLTLGRATHETPGPITLSGIGDHKTVSRDGAYKITLPLCNGNEASMTGLCLDKVTGTFPLMSLKKVEDDIMKHHHGDGSGGKIPRLPAKVGGETDIIIGVKYLKYFPKETYKLPSGLTIFEAMFKNLDGSLGVVAGPYPLISNEWDKIGQVAHSYVVMPVNRENLESPDCNSESPPPPHAGNLASRHKNRRKRPKRKKSKNPFSCDEHPYILGAMATRGWMLW